MIRKLLLILIVFSLGFIARPLMEETYQFITEIRFQQCSTDYWNSIQLLTQKERDKKPSTYQFCRKEYEKRLPGDILLYSPKLWCNLDPIVCSDSGYYLKVDILDRKHWIKNDQF